MHSNAQLLSEVPLFKGVGNSSLTLFADAAVRRRTQKEEILFREGDEGGALYIILSGKVRIERTTRAGETHILALRKAGEVIGEMSLVEHKPRSASAICEVDCKLLMLQRAEFQRLIMIEPSASLVIMQTLSRRVREATDMLLDFRTKEVPDRLLDLLKREADADGSVNVMRSQTALAEEVGCSREAVNRAITELITRGKIARLGKRLFQLR